MKCPKCNYLGFETGDRCKNCGYDFSLLSIAESAPADYEIHPPAIDDVPVHVVDDIDPQDDPWIGDKDPVLIKHDPALNIRGEIDDSLGNGLVMLLASETLVESREPISQVAPHVFSQEPVEEPDTPTPIAPFLSAMSLPSSSNERGLPLFKRAQEETDEPLIKLPLAPRPPLAVRRTPDTPRLRAVPRPVSPPASVPLQFSDEGTDRPPAPAQPQNSAPAERVRSTLLTEESRAGSRLAAVFIDYLILFGIDAAVVYFTLRIAGLSMQELTALPLAPMVAFLGLLKVSYFCVFTAVGGQTIGKMAVGTCVVSDNGEPLDPTQALRRTSAGIVSFLLLGLGFIPALFGDNRALHDRLAGTRVVRLRSV